MFDFATLDQHVQEVKTSQAGDNTIQLTIASLIKQVVWSPGMFTSSCIILLLHAVYKLFAFETTVDETVQVAAAGKDPKI